MGKRGRKARFNTEQNKPKRQKMRWVWLLDVWQMIMTYRSYVIGVIIAITTAMIAMIAMIAILFWLESAMFVKVAEVVKKEFGDPNMVICSSYDFAEWLKVGTILKENSAQKNAEYVHAELMIGDLVSDPDFQINSTKGKNASFSNKPEKGNKVEYHGSLQDVPVNHTQQYDSTLIIKHLEHSTDKLNVISLQNYLNKRKLVSEELRNSIQKVAGSRPSADEDRKHLVIVSKVLYAWNIDVSYGYSLSIYFYAQFLLFWYGKDSIHHNRQDPIAQCYEVNKLFVNNHTGDDMEGDCFLSISQKDDSMLIVINSSGVRFVEAGIQQDTGGDSWTAVVVWLLVLAIVVIGMIKLLLYYMCDPPRVTLNYKDSANNINQLFAERDQLCTKLTVCKNWDFASSLQVGTVLQRVTVDGTKTFKYTNKHITFDQMTKDKLSLKIDKSDSHQLDDPPMTGICLRLRKTAILWAKWLWRVKPKTCFTDTLNDAFHDLEDNRKLNSGKAKDVIKWTYHKVAPTLRNRCLCVVTKVLYADNLHFKPEPQATPNAGQSSKDKNTGSGYTGMTRINDDEEKDGRIAISFEVQELRINIIDYSFEAVEEGGFYPPPSNTSLQATVAVATTSTTEETIGGSIVDLGTAEPVQDDPDLKGNDVTEDESAAEGGIAAGNASDVKKVQNSNEETERRHTGEGRDANDSSENISVSTSTNSAE